MDRASANGTATEASPTSASPSASIAGTDRPSVLFDRAVAWLLSVKVLLPGLSVLERAVARVRSRANGHLHRRLIKGVTPSQRERLDGLVIVREGDRQSTFDRLRDGPYIQSGPEIGRALVRLGEIRVWPSVRKLTGTAQTC